VVAGELLTLTGYSIFDPLMAGAIALWIIATTAREVFASHDELIWLPSRPHIAVAVARSGGQGRRFFSAAEGLSLTDASTAAGCP
jgi:hypothetical protein